MHWSLPDRPRCSCSNTSNQLALPTGKAATCPNPTPAYSRCIRTLIQTRMSTAPPMYRQSQQQLAHCGRSINCLETFRHTSACGDPAERCNASTYHNAIKVMHTNGPLVTGAHTTPPMRRPPVGQSRRHHIGLQIICRRLTPAQTAQTHLCTRKATHA